MAYKSIEKRAVVSVVGDGVGGLGLTVRLGWSDAAGGWGAFTGNGEGVGVKAGIEVGMAPIEAIGTCDEGVAVGASAAEGPQATATATRQARARAFVRRIFGQSNGG